MHLVNPPIALGIDPGLTGAISLVSATRVLKLLDLESALNKTPAHTVPTNKKSMVQGSYHDIDAIIDFLMPFTLGRQGRGPWRKEKYNRYEAVSDRKYYPQIIVVEDVSAQNPNSSGSSMFKLGQVKGLLSAVVHILFPEVPIKYIRPSVWKPHLGLSTDKRKSLVMAKEIWKEQEDLFSFMKHVDRAEASLLAYCGLRMIK